MKIDVLGVKYDLIERPQEKDSRLNDCDGYCDWTTRTIVVEREMTGTLEDMEVYVKKVKRHEIVHAFLIESGLNECSGESSAWARNEVMVDWFARMGTRIYEAWQQAKAI